MALNNFFNFVTDFKSVAGLIGKAAIIAPFMDLLLNIGPPWPARTAVPALCALAEVLVLIYIFQFSTPQSKSRLQKRLKNYFLLLIFCFIGYIILYSIFIYDVPLTKSNDVKGFVINPAVEEIIGPDLTIDKALEGAEWDAFVIWEAWTIHVTRIGLLLAWILFFVGISGCIATFVTLQGKTVKQGRG
jgi:hypothetical protein